MTVAAVYLRVSKSDATDDESLTLETQRRRIRSFCDARDWEYGPEYIDDGISATKARDASTQWAAMLADLSAGKFDVIVARDLDRLLRTLQDLVKLIDLNAKVATVDGEIDLTTADGEFRATMLAAVARFEIRRKSERAIHANETRRRKGLPIQRVRILGYDEDGVTQIDDEAAAVKRAFEDFRNGLGLAQVARDLNEAGFRTSRGRPWSTQNLRSMFENTRYKGVITKWDPKVKGGGNTLKEKLARKQYPGDFEAIVTAEVWDAVQLRFSDPLRKRNWGTAPVYLLTGLARCGRCDDGTRVFTKYYRRSPSTLADGTVRSFAPRRLYGCVEHNHLTRQAQPVEEFVEEQLLWYLRQVDAEALFGEKKLGEAERDALQSELAGLDRRYKDLTAMFVDEVLDVDSVRDASARIRTRTAELKSLLAAPPSNPGLDLLRAGESLEAEWARMSLQRKRYVLSQVMEVTILPAPEGHQRSKKFDPELIRIDWLT